MLGLVDFSEVQQLQRRIVYELGEQAGAALILCEHPPTISVGRSGSRAHIGPDDETLQALGIKVHWVNRGGGCVLHLPGQLAAYFALPLDTFGLTSRAISTGCTSTIMHGPRGIRSRGVRPRGFARRVLGAGSDRHRRRGRQPLDRLPWSHAQRRAVP